MRIKTAHLFTEDFRVLLDKTWGQRIKYFWRKSWNEVPEMTLLGLLSFTTMPITFFCCYKRNDGRQPRYYLTTTIFRPEDPLCAGIRRDNGISLQRSNAL